VKTPYQLLDLYYQSVGRGASLDLGIAPNREGVLDHRDVESLRIFGDLLRRTFAVNLAKGATFTASDVRGNNQAKFGPAFLTDGDRYSYWATDDAVLTPELVVDMGKPTLFNVIRLRENIKLGQRISAFTIEAFVDGEWKRIGEGTSIGANRLIRLQQHVVASKVRLRVTGSGACIALSDLGLFREPAHLAAPSILRDKQGLVSIHTEAPVAGIRYTLDGTEPGPASTVYEGPFLLTEGGLVKTRSFERDGTASEVSTRQLGLSKTGWKVIEATGGGTAAAAIDDEVRTLWSTLIRDSPVVAKFPQDISIDMGKVQVIKAFTYLPRQDKKTDGTVDRYAFYTSEDGTNWVKAAEGEFANIRANPLEQVVSLDHPLSARYIKFSVLQVVAGNGAVVAEVGVRVN
jgi:alpha-L-fucosidase